MAALGGGVAFALVATLSGVAATSAHAADGIVQGDSWSNDFGSVKAQQPWSSFAAEAPDNVEGAALNDAWDLITGVSASSGDEGSGKESVQSLLDRGTSKWLKKRVPSDSNPMEATFTFSADVRVTHYRMMSGNDDADRAPISWTVYGSDDGSTWTPVDTVTDFAWNVSGNHTNNSTAWFDVASPGTYSQYKLSITKIDGGSMMQMSQWFPTIDGGPSAADDPMSDIVSVDSNYPNTNNYTESMFSLTDRNPETKWYTAYGNYPTPERPVYAIYTFATPQELSSYDVVSARDVQKRDPKAWTVLGTNDPTVAADPASEDWVVLDSEDNISFDQRWQAKNFPLSSPGSYQYVQLRATEVADSSDNKFQIGDWTLFGDSSPSSSTLNNLISQSPKIDGTNGSDAIYYSGSVISDAAASSSNRLYSSLDVTVGSHGVLRYSVLPTSDNGRAVALDVTYADADGSHPGVLDLSTVTDLDGGDPTPSAHATSLPQGEWSTVEVPLDSIAGKVVTGMSLDFDKPDATQGPVSGWFDNVAITSDDRVGPLDVTAHSDLSSAVGQPLQTVLATVAGATATSNPPAVSATFDPGAVGASSVALDVVTDGDGAVTLALPSTFTFATAGVHSGSITTSDGTDTVTTPVTVSVGQGDGAAFQAIANMRCIIVQGENPDCDGAGWAFDKDHLADPSSSGGDGAPFVQGATGTVPIDGTDFHFQVPQPSLADQDNIVPDSQNWYVSPPEDTQQIIIIGTGTESTQTRDLVLHYSDGTSETLTVTFGDWVGAATNPVAGSSVVTHTKGRMSQGGDDNKDASLFASDPVTLDTTGAGDPKVLTSIEFPEYIPGKGQVHVFAYGTDTDSRVRPVVDAGEDVTAVVATASTMSLGTVSAGDGSYTATVNWGDGSPLEDATVEDGAVTGTHEYASAGDHTAQLTVVSGGESVTVPVGIDVQKQAMDVGLTASSSSPTIGDDVTFTASLDPAEALGTVQFQVDGSDVGSALTPSGGVATWTTSDLTVGEHQVDAVYSGSDLYQSSTASVSVTVEKLATTLTPHVPAHASAGDTVTVTVDVDPADATGTIEFAIDGDSAGDPAPVTDGTATLTTPALAVGDYTIVASYSGDATHAAATAAPQSVSVTRSSSSIVLTAPATADPGTPVTVTAEVTPSIATGSVQLMLDGIDYGGPMVVSEGTASWSLTNLAVGTHTLTAAYSGDDNLDGTASAPSTVTVTPRPASVTLEGPSVVTLGHPVAIAASVAPADATGSMQLMVDGVDHGAPVAISQGAVSWSLSDLTAGDHTITAVYSGDATYRSAASDSLAVTVETIPTTTTLQATASRLVAGDDVTFVTTVAPAPGDGTIQLADADGPISGPVVVTGGQAVLTVSSLGVGTHDVTATYSGSDVSAPSVSAPVRITVEAAATLGAPTFSKGTQAYHAKGAKRATVSVAVTGAATGTVVFRSGDVVVARTTVRTPAGGGTAVARVRSKLPVGSYRGVVATLVTGSATIMSPASSETVEVTKAELKKFKVKGKKKTKKHHKSWVKVKVSKKLNSNRTAKGKVWIKVKKHGTFTNYKKRSMKKFRTAGGKLKIKIAKRFATGKKIRVKVVYKPKKAQKAGVKKAKGKVKTTVKK